MNCSLFPLTEIEYYIPTTGWQFADVYKKYGVVSSSHAFETLKEDINLANYLEDQTQAETVKKAIALVSSLINEFYKREIFEYDYSNCNY